MFFIEGKSSTSSLRFATTFVHKTHMVFPLGCSQSLPFSSLEFIHHKLPGESPQCDANLTMILEFTFLNSS